MWCFCQLNHAMKHIPKDVLLSISRLNQRSLFWFFIPFLLSSLLSRPFAPPSPPHTHFLLSLPLGRCCTLAVHVFYQCLWIPHSNNSFELSAETCLSGRTPLLLLLLFQKAVLLPILRWFVDSFLLLLSAEVLCSKSRRMSFRFDVRNFKGWREMCFFFIRHWVLLLQGKTNCCDVFMIPLLPTPLLWLLLFLFLFNCILYCLTTSLI